MNKEKLEKILKGRTYWGEVKKVWKGSYKHLKQVFNSWLESVFNFVVYSIGLILWIPLLLVIIIFNSFKSMYSLCKYRRILNKEADND